jgi:hypothetical protein
MCCAVSGCCRWRCWLAQDYPEFRQAATLKADVDDRVVKDGLLGLGVVGAVAAVALGVIFGAGRKH